jgi:hypothetical protein
MEYLSDEDYSKLEKKSWYRLGKTVYSVVLLSIIVISLVIFWGLKPNKYETTDYDSASIICWNKDSEIPLKRLSTSYLSYDKDTDTLSSGDNRKAWAFCSGPYAINIKSEIIANGSWWAAIGYGALFFVITKYILNLIKKYVLYITVGKVPPE